jgi:hypothetical protein
VHIKKVCLNSLSPVLKETVCWPMTSKDFLVTPYGFSYEFSISPFLKLGCINDISDPVSMIIFMIIPANSM